MADEEQLNILRQGADVWNEWVEQHPDVSVDLTGAYLSGADLTKANLNGVFLSGADLHRAILTESDLTGAYLRGADLIRANLSGAYLVEATLTAANLYGADLSGAYLTAANLTAANLSGADLSGANLTAANLSGAILVEANLSGAALSRADLSRASLIRTKLNDAKLYDCRIYGLSVWDVDLEGAEQSNLIITPEDQPTITVDNLNVAQFIHLLLNSPEVRELMDTITSKAVLILGRFTPERKKTLDAIHGALRQKGYVPIMFDFDKPASMGFMETVSILAHMARFVVADITDEKVALAELYQMVKEHPSKPLQPVLLKGKSLNVLDYDFGLYRSYLPVYEYAAEGELLETLTDKVIAPAERMIESQKERHRPSS